MKKADIKSLQRRTYSKEINGLRAVAVVLVLIYHLDLPLCPAGFLGVDVFLVISGFLISRNIIDDLKNKSFNLLSFYTRRFKRLYAALLFTLAASFAAGYFLLPPSNFEQLSRTILSGLYFHSNVFFFRESGYFDTESAFKPLLHIWSLSLEEQFYFVWPALLFLIFHISKRGLIIVVTALLAASLILCEIYLPTTPAAVFYLLPFRFFEFLLGSVCVWLIRLSPRNEFLRELMLLGGLALIGYAATSYTVLTPMPGLLSLIPCLGTMMVITAGNVKYSGLILRNKLSEFVGKSSYSIYLAHWPIIVYFRYYTLTEISLYDKMLLALASILCGYLMWKFIENIFRSSQVKVIKVDAIWLWMPATMALITLIAMDVRDNEGYASRFPAEFRMTEEEISQNRAKYWQATNPDKEILKGNDTAEVIIMGNSFAIDLIYALRKNGLDAKITSIQTSHRCYNFGANAVNKADESWCNAVKRKNLSLENWRNTKSVYLFDHWPQKNTDSLNSILSSIRKLTEAPIYVFGPKMVFSRPVPDIVHMCRSASPNAINNFAQQFALKDDRLAMNEFLKDYFSDESFRKNNIKYIDVLKIVGGEDTIFDIVSRKTNQFLYFDPSHFTDQGANEFGEKLKKLHPYVYEIH